MMRKHIYTTVYAKDVTGPQKTVLNFKTVAEYFVGAVKVTQFDNQLRIDYEDGTMRYITEI
jgi:hypothetical protein